MARVFISFVHEDESIANALKRLISHELQLGGGEVFLSSDTNQVSAGDDWLDKVRAALESCEVFLGLFDARSVQRRWVNFEAGAAWIQDGS